MQKLKESLTKMLRMDLERDNQVKRICLKVILFVRCVHRKKDIIEIRG